MNANKFFTIVIRNPQDEEGKKCVKNALAQLEPYQTAISSEDEMTILEMIEQHPDFDESIAVEAREQTEKLHAKSELVAIKEQESSMKIFQMNDCYWFVGGSIEACTVECYGQYKPQCEVRELRDSELDTLMFIVTNENEVPDGTKRTFREQLKIEIATGGTFPRQFACLDFDFYRRSHELPTAL